MTSEGKNSARNTARFSLNGGDIVVIRKIMHLDSNLLHLKLQGCTQAGISTRHLSIWFEKTEKNSG